MRKHLTLIDESPEIYKFPRRMENIYGRVGAEFRKEKPKEPDYRRTFFRENRSTDDLFRYYEKMKGEFKPASDDSMEFDFELDAASGCEESCEVFNDEDMKHVIEDDE